MRFRRRGFLHLAAGALALPALPRLSVADSYPSRRITMVVPFAPGALSDILGRVMAEGMQASLGQSIVIDNASGADGTIGSGRVAHAIPDGYTLVCANWNTSVTNAAIYKLDYDVVTDFEPVVLLPAAPMVLLAKKDNPATNLKEFIAWLKANPDKASFGTAGAGSPPDLLGRLLRRDTGTQFNLIAYRGAAPAMQDVIAGHIDAVFITIAAAQPQVRAGNVKALGVTTPRAHQDRARNPDHGRGGIARLLFRAMGGDIRAARHAERHHRQAQRRGGENLGRSERPAEARSPGL